MIKTRKVSHIVLGLSTIVLAALFIFSIVVRIEIAITMFLFITVLIVYFLGKEISFCTFRNDFFTYKNLFQSKEILYVQIGRIEIYNIRGGCILEVYIGDDHQAKIGAKKLKTLSDSSKKLEEAFDLMKSRGVPSTNKII